MEKPSLGWHLFTNSHRVLRAQVASAGLHHEERSGPFCSSNPAREVSKQRSDGWAFGSVIYDEQEDRPPVSVEGVSTQAMIC